MVDYNMERKVENVKTQPTLVKYLLFSYYRKKTNFKCQMITIVKTQLSVVFYLSWL